MKRINDRQVILTRKEQQAYRLFDSLLDRGHSIDDAIDVIRDGGASLSPEFVAYLRGEGS